MKTLLCSLLLCSAVSAFSQTRDSVYVQFSHDEYSLDRNAIWLIDNLIRPYPPNAVTNIWLSGHTDSTGSNQYNMALSVKRAERVSEYLQTKGYTQNTIKKIAVGYHQPLLVEDNDYNRYQNRRVKIVFELNDLVMDSLKKVVDQWDMLVEEIPLNNEIDTLRVNNGNPSITIDPGKSHFIVSENTGIGVCITKDAINCKVFPTISISTYNTVTDIVNTGMFTISDGKPLESGGFFNVTATVNGQEIEINDGMNVTVIIPAENYDPEMRIFTANTNANGMNWEQRRNGKSNYDPNLRYDDSLKAYIVTVTGTGWINLDKKVPGSFVLKVKSGRLINRNHQLIAASKDRVTAVNLKRKRRIYRGRMAQYGDQYQVIHKNGKGDTYVVEGNYKRVISTKKQTVVVLKLRKNKLLPLSESENWTTAGN